MIDSHIHLERYTDAFLKEHIYQWQEAGVEKVVAVSNNLKSAYRTLELKQRYPDFILACIGYHPEQVPQQASENKEMMKLIYQERKVISAIGEVGLPYYTAEKLTNKEEQTHVEQFEVWVAAAEELCLPIAIHAVHEKAGKALSILNKHQVQGHFHWLKGTQHIVEEIIKSRHFISITPDIHERIRDQNLAKLVPIEQIFLETDGPWQFGGKFQWKQTVPAMIIEVAHVIANIKGETLESVLKQTTDNVRRYYINRQ